jgi:PAS domain S-box-containing protein
MRPLCSGILCERHFCAIGRTWRRVHNRSMGEGFRETALSGATDIERTRFMVTCDAEGSLLELSSEVRRFTGASPAHYSGFRWLELVHRDDRARIVELIGTHSAAVSPPRCRFRRFDGEFRWFEIMVEAMTWSVIEQGQPGPRKVTARVVLSATEVESAA